MSKRRVVVTGLGLVTPVGNTVDTTWKALLSGKSGIAPITKFDKPDRNKLNKTYIQKKGRIP